MYGHVRPHPIAKSPSPRYHWFGKRYHSCSIAWSVDPSASSRCLSAAPPTSVWNKQRWLVLLIRIPHLWDLLEWNASESWSLLCFEPWLHLDPFWSFHFFSLTLTDCVSVWPRIENILRWISVKLEILKRYGPCVTITHLGNLAPCPPANQKNGKISCSWVAKHPQRTSSPGRQRGTAPYVPWQHHSCRHTGQNDSPRQKKTGEGSVLTLGCKSEKKHRKNLEYQKNQKNGFWVLTPDAISCQMKHPDWN